MVHSSKKNHADGQHNCALSFWRVLKGPNNDWPLALCDYKNVDPEHDVIANDIIFPTAVGENRLLMANKNHRWFYMSNQMPNEIMVFRNASSAGACSACKCSLTASST